MEKIRRLNLKQLKPEDREELELFTEPQFRCCLEGKDPYNITDTTIVAIGSTSVGLALASIFPELSFAIVHSIQAKDGMEEQLESLFNLLEKELANEKATNVSFKFYDDGKKSNVLWKVLKKRAWAEPELFMLKYFFHVHTFNTPWLKKPAPFTKKFKEFPWKNLKPHEKAELHRKENQNYFPLHLSPFFVDESLIDPINSLGLRYNGKVIGWMITLIVAPSTLSYAILYIDPEFQKTGYAMRLLADAIEINKRSNLAYAIFEINIEQSDARWLAFIERRLAPYAIDVAKVFSSWKTLEDL
jgi:GNAT superfamily N-acetyltransferase